MKSQHEGKSDMSEMQLSVRDGFWHTCWCGKLGNVRIGNSRGHGDVRIEDAGRVLDGACDEDQQP